MNESAIKDFSKAIDANPDHINAFYSRGVASSNLSHFEEAIKDFDKVIEMNSEWDTAYYQRGLTYTKLNNDNKALADFKMAITLNPDFEEALSEIIKLENSIDELLDDKKEGTTKKENTD